MSSSTASPRRFRSKTLTAALAFLLGSIGAHRFYLYGFRDVYGWAHLLATIVGIPGFLLLAATQRSAGLGWWLAVPGAISLLAAFLAGAGPSVAVIARRDFARVERLMASIYERGPYQATVRTLAVHQSHEITADLVASAHGRTL